MICFLIPINLSITFIMIKVNKSDIFYLKSKCSHASSRSQSPILYAFLKSLQSQFSHNFPKVIMNLIQSPFFLCKGQIEMSVSTKKCFKTVLSRSVWTICGLIVVYQSILCLEKYIENPKGTEVFMTDGLNEMFPHFTICSGTKQYKTSDGCNMKW